MARHRAMGRRAVSSACPPLCQDKPPQLSCHKAPVLRGQWSRRRLPPVLWLLSPQCGADSSALYWRRRVNLLWVPPCSRHFSTLPKGVSHVAKPPGVWLRPHLPSRDPGAHWPDTGLEPLPAGCGSALNHPCYPNPTPLPPPGGVGSPSKPSNWRCHGWRWG